MDELFGDTTEEEFSVESFIDDETFILEVTVGGRRCLNIHSAYPHIHISILAKYAVGLVHGNSFPAAISIVWSQLCKTES